MGTTAVRGRQVWLMREAGTARERSPLPTREERVSNFRGNGRPETVFPCWVVKEFKMKMLQGGGVEIPVSSFSVIC